MCSKKKILALESRDLSRAEKETTAFKAEQIHLKRQPRAILSENSCHFVNCLACSNGSSQLEISHVLNETTSEIQHRK